MNGWIMAHIVERGQDCVEVSVAADIKEEGFSEITKDSGDSMVCSSWHSSICILTCTKMSSLLFNKFIPFYGSLYPSQPNENKYLNLYFFVVFINAQLISLACLNTNLIMSWYYGYNVSQIQNDYFCLILDSLFFFNFIFM